MSQLTDRETDNGKSKCPLKVGIKCYILDLSESNCFLFTHFSVLKIGSVWQSLNNLHHTKINN